MRNGEDSEDGEDDEEGDGGEKCVKREMVKIGRTVGGKVKMMRIV